MTAATLVDVVCDAGERIGTGHVRRAQALVAQLTADGIPARALGLSETARRLLGEPSTGQPGAPVVVFDAPEGLDGPIGAVQRDGRVAVTLDWFGNAAADINIAVFAHTPVRARRHAHCGFEFIMVRDEILRLRGSGAGAGVVVALGGGDVLRQGHAAARALAASPGGATLVMGPLAEGSREGYGYEVRCNPPDFAWLLASCSWAVTNGGGCLFEALCLGRPAYVLPQTPAESAIARFAREQEAILGMGLERLRDFGEGDNAAVAARGAALVDGRGAARISTIIQELL